MKLFISFFTFLLATSAFSQEINHNPVEVNKIITETEVSNTDSETELTLNGFPLPTTNNTTVNKRHQFRYILNRYC